MSEYLTAAQMKALLVEALTIQVRNARLGFDDAPHDQGDPQTGRVSTADSIRYSVRLLREMKAVPEDDPRIIRLTELVPTADHLMAVPDDSRISAGSAGAFLDDLVREALKTLR